MKPNGVQKHPLYNPYKAVSFEQLLNEEGGERCAVIRYFEINCKYPPPMKIKLSMFDFIDELFIFTSTYKPSVLDNYILHNYKLYDELPPMTLVWLYYSGVSIEELNNITAVYRQEDSYVEEFINIFKKLPVGVQ